jgi:PhnB protein
MPLRVSPHLTFNGQCEAAFLVYQKLLAGKIVTMLSYGQSPLAPSVDPKWHGRIIHATMLLGAIELTGVDLLPPDFQKPQGFYITLTFDDLERATSVFDSLSLGGEIRFPFQETFWSSGFGALVDRFGVPWEVSTATAGVVA